MGVTLGTFTDATVMSQPAVATEIAAWRAWQNAILAGDVVDSSILSQHLFRPDILGFPEQVYRSPQQAVYWRSKGVTYPWVPATSVSTGVGATLQTREPIAGAPERISIFPPELDGGERFVVSGVAATVYLDRASVVEGTAHWDYWTEYDGAQGTSPWYPNTVAQSERGGNFALVYRDRAGTADTYVEGTQRPIYPGYANALITVIGDVWKHSAHFVESLGPGTFDFFLAYQRGQAPTSLTQIVVSNRSLVIEVHST
jgi:hypothetical protein